MKLPAIVTAGDRRAARPVYGESKVYLEVDGLPLVARVVAVLQQVPEISEVWVVGNAERLEDVFQRAEVSAPLEKPLHILGQFRNLFENCWESYRRALPGAGPDGRDPEAADADFEVLYLSADLPFATPEEISDFIRRGRATGCDYAVGLVPEESLHGFLPSENDGVGIELAYFNMCEGRLRQSNLHFAKPARIGARELIEEMYENRHQRNPWNMFALGWKLLANEAGGIRVLFFYLLIHLGGLADRWGLRRLADRLRRVIVGRGLWSVLGTHVGGQLDHHGSPGAAFQCVKRAPHDRCDLIRPIDGLDVLHHPLVLMHRGIVRAHGNLT